MLGLYHSRIIVDRPLLDINNGDQIRSTSRIEKYENKIKSNFNREKVFQTIRIIQNYSISPEESNQVAREFYKKSKSFAKISSFCSKNEESSIMTKRKFSTTVENSFKERKKEIFDSPRFELVNPNYDKIISYMINRILVQRSNSAKLISSTCKKFLISLKIKNQIIIEKIKSIRINNTIMIQKHVRRYLIKKHISILRTGYDLIFFYDYKENNKIQKTINEKQINSHPNNSNFNKNISKTADYCMNEYLSPKEIKIRILKEKSDAVEVKLFYTKILKMYYLPFNKKGVMRRRFKVNFVVDGKMVIDPRFQVDNDENGNFFNIIESSTFKKKNFKPNVFEFNQSTQKFWENIFEIKSNFNKDNSSVSDMSEQTETTIERLLYKHNSYLQRQKRISENNPKKSILRNSPTYDTTKSSQPNSDKNFNKKVSFNDKVEYSS